ncbi:MAG: acetyl-CoA carboxylase biotin carboxyl carrier protein [Gemmatimonadota bacterium]
MNEDRIRRLIEIFRESGVEEMEYQESFWRGWRLRLGRNRQGPVILQAPAVTAAPASPSPAPLAVAAAPAGGSPPPPVDTGLHTLASPMVGTFYRSSSPDSEPFAREGDRVRAGQTVCIIEAMKIMNEIEADVAGEVVVILAEDGGPVEYNQPLLHIRPA